nr:3-oxoacyl-ACP reductase [uncultured Ligilactobacillus sp.]
MNLYPEFKNKKIILTGVASGIGNAQARAFLDAGAIIFGADVQQNEAVEKLAQEANFHFAKVDVRSLQEITDWIKPILAKNQIDILVNTAGILDGFAPTLETSEEQWDNIFNTNLKSIFRITNLVLPQMLEQHHGVIVNMASIAGMVAGGGGAAYTAAKSGIIGYTKQLDYDYAAKGIRANSIAPGAIETPMNAADFAGDAHMAKWVADETPAKRWAKPEEVAALTMFLASPRADYIHGVAVPIDGGWIEK